jgi:NAD+ synthase (glutamine-hydrolysing)
MLSTPTIKVANIDFNVQQILNCIDSGVKSGADYIVFGKNCLHGQALGKMNSHKSILQAINNGINKIKVYLVDKPCTVLVSSIYNYENQIKSYNFVINAQGCSFFDKFLTTKFGNKIHFHLDNSYALIRTRKQKLHQLTQLSKKEKSIVVFTSTGLGEYTGRGVCSGDKIVIDNGIVLADCGYEKENIFVDINISRKHINDVNLNHNCTDDTGIDDKNPLPFVPKDERERENILSTLQTATYQRVKETKSNGVIIGVSGGIDSAMALVLATSIQKKHADFGKIYAVTMHAHATSELSKKNSKDLIQACGAIHIDIPITQSIKNHLQQLGHDGKHDLTYENSHARRRTSILLDLANMYGVIQLGTGDMSEIALGWSTYGGDQLSHFNPNSNLTKTMIRDILPYLAKSINSSSLHKIILKIVKAPVSPELVEGQKTETILGPYMVLDYILYHFIYQCQTVKHTFNLCRTVFADIEINDLKKYFNTFITRFFANQFKVKFSCDGVRIMDFDISDLHLPTNFDSSIFLQELQEIV